jgi:PhnB protein
VEAIMTVQNPPKGYHSVAPCLTVDGAAAAIASYANAFGTTEIIRMPMRAKMGG